MNKTYYYALHVQVDEKYGYSVAVESDEHFNVGLDDVWGPDETEVIKLALGGGYFEEDSDYLFVDLIYELSEKEYKEFKNIH